MKTVFSPRVIGRGRRAAAIGLGLAGLVGLGGCASQQMIDQLQSENRSLKDRNTELSRLMTEKDNELVMLQRERAASDALIRELQGANSQLRGQLGDAGVSLEELQRRLAGMTFGPLDPQTDQALKALAAQYPDLIRYDEARGMLRFASDLTFDSGSDVVKDNARQALSALARVLGGASAASYELFILGHTDSQRISAGTAQRHPTNVHLSAHRAISVRSALTQLGVPSQKMLVAGWGEFRPAVANAPNGNTPANRRVEIFLTRPTDGAMASVATDPSVRASPDRDAPPPRQPEPQK